MTTQTSTDYRLRTNTENLTWLYVESRDHFKRRWKYWLAYVVALLTFTLFFKVGINATESLPYKGFIVSKFDHSFKRGDLMDFVWQGGGTYPKGFEFVKIVGGLPGDKVSFEGRKVFVNGNYIGEAKPVSRFNIPLELGPSGVIPPGKFFVYTNHKDSLDSRYAITGWIDESAVIGKAYGLF